ncbi:MAG: Spore coat polysaccharide biosynthesis protein [bacterium]|nr:Spore coat polysaccharide biosynthesis protein [bacterium]
MQIGATRTDERVAIVAEIGNNHEGRFDVARRMVEAAALTGVDAVKFQTFRTKYFTSGSDPARFARLSRFELTQAQFTELAQLARSLGVGFISTPLDLESARFLAPLVDVFKIASGDNDFLPLIAEVCKTGKSMIVSTGLADLALLRRTRDFIRAEWQARAVSAELAMLQCGSAYPVPPEETNLRAIPLIAGELGVTVGYSDHTLGIEACLGAVALGARILEKHFTLDKHYSDFRDHQLSADPDEMRRLVESVRKMEKLLGRAEKSVQPGESANQKMARRSIVAAGELAAGHRVTLDDLTWIRPAVGLPPGEEAQLLGKRLKRAVTFGEPLTPGDVE